MKNILIVEDDESINNLIQELLTKENFNVFSAYSGSEALMLLENKNIDLIILDLMLPGVSGEKIIKTIKNIPIIVLSAKASIEDKINCLNSGANDYMTKPFDGEELLARIKVQLRTNISSSGSLKYKNLELLKDNHTLLLNNHKINLTKTEYAILKQLLINPAQVIPKNRLLDLISIDTEDCSEYSLRVHISNIRRKLREYSNQEYIESVFGIGFKLTE